MDQPKTTDDDTDVNAGPPRTEIEDHQRTFDAFMSLTKWGTVAVVVLLIGMAVFLL